MGWLRDVLESRFEDARSWCREERSPWLRLLLLLYLAYGGVRHLLDDDYRTWFAGITLAFHEMGHILLSPFGNTTMLLGGSLFQVLIPTVAGVYLLRRQRDYFGLAVSGGWLAFALWELAIYIYDAPRERLALVGFGDHPQHDWGTLLTQWQLLNSSDTLAAIVRASAFTVWAAAIALGAWLCWLIARSDDTTT